MLVFFCENRAERGGGRGGVGGPRCDDVFSVQVFFFRQPSCHGSGDLKTRIFANLPYETNSETLHCNAIQQVAVCMNQDAATVTAANSIHDDGIRFVPCNTAM